MLKYFFLPLRKKRNELLELHFCTAHCTQPFIYQSSVLSNPTWTELFQQTVTLTCTEAQSHVIWLISITAALLCAVTDQHRPVWFKLLKWCKRVIYCISFFIYASTDLYSIYLMCCSTHNTGQILKADQYQYLKDINDATMSWVWKTKCLAN